MQEKVGEAGGRALQIRGGQGIAEDGIPDVQWKLPQRGERRPGLFGVGFFGAHTVK
jgi:hypothetical protein